MEKLKPTIRPRSVKHAASTVRKSSRAFCPSDAYLPRTLAPIQTQAHKVRKETTKVRNGESVRRLMAYILLSVRQLQKVEIGNRYCVRSGGRVNRKTVGGRNSYGIPPTQ